LSTKALALTVARTAKPVSSASKVTLLPRCTNGS
jgi:hypothetical protein